MSGSEELVLELRRVVEAAGPMAAGPVCVRIPVPPGLFSETRLARLAVSAGAESFYWRHPHEDVSILGLGRVRTLQARGKTRFTDAHAEACALWRELSVLGDPAPAAAGPLLVGGFAFGDEPAQEAPWDGFPAGELVLSRLLLVRRGGEAWLSLSARSPGALREELGGDAVAELFEGAAIGVRVDPEADAGVGPEYRVRSDRSHADYRAQVEAARCALAAGDIEKVVLARSLRVRHDGRFDLAGLVPRLSRTYPRCVTFVVSRPGARFLGATPELLVARSGSQLRTAAVAGSAPRGRTPEEDARLGRALRESKKEQEEHAIVVRAIREALVGSCSSLEIPEAPQLLRIEGIQHLKTPVTGTLREPQSLLELASRLHPTPAVGGSPSAAALEWIRRFEKMERGWYAGPVGYVDAEGSGELRVALRSGLIREGARGDDAYLFAGGGLVADSDPERELEETRVKLRALLAPLTEI